MVLAYGLAWIYWCFIYILQITVEGAVMYKSMEVQSEDVGHKSQWVQTDDEGKKSVHTQTEQMVSISEEPNLQGT